MIEGTWTPRLVTDVEYRHVNALQHDWEGLLYHTYAVVSTAGQDTVVQYRMLTQHFGRICRLGVERHLPFLARFADDDVDDDDCQIWKNDAVEFAAELRLIRAAIDDPELGQHVDALLNLVDRLIALPGDIAPRLEIRSGWVSRWE